VAGDIAEYIANNWTQEKQNSNDHNGHQNQDQRILYQPLALFSWQKQHIPHLLSFDIVAATANQKCPAKRLLPGSGMIILYTVSS
jgi:hypothetical protein